MATTPQAANYSEIPASLARLKEINDKLRALQTERVSVIAKLRLCEESLRKELDIHCADIPVVIVPQASSDMPKLVSQ
jgi:hypothetical protein